MKPVKGIPHWFLLMLKLFKFKMEQSKVSYVFFSDFVSMEKHMMVSHLDSSKRERCTVKFSKMFLTRYVMIRIL